MIWTKQDMRSQSHYASHVISCDIDNMVEEEVEKEAVVIKNSRTCTLPLCIYKNSIGFLCNMDGCLY